MLLAWLWLGLRLRFVNKERLLEQIKPKTGREKMSPDFDRYDAMAISGEQCIIAIHVRKQISLKILF